MSRFSDEDLLDCLPRLHKQHGFVTAQIIREDENSPTPMLFTVRFGSLLKAYACAGIENRRFDIWSRAGKARAAARRARKLTTESQA